MKKLLNIEYILIFKYFKILSIHLKQNKGIQVCLVDPLLMEN